MRSKSNSNAKLSHDKQRLLPFEFRNSALSIFPDVGTYRWVFSQMGEKPPVAGLRAALPN